MNEKLTNNEMSNDEQMPKASKGIETRMSQLENMMAETMKAIKRKHDDYDEEWYKSETERLSHDEESEDPPPPNEWLTDNEDQGETEKINPNVAKYIDTKVAKRIPKEQLRVKTERQKRTRNVRYVREVQINNPIYNKLGSYARKRDAGFRAMQGLVSKAIIAMAKTAQSVICMKKEE